MSFAASAEAGREFDKLATALTTPRHSLTREVNLVVSLSRTPSLITSPFRSHLLPSYDRFALFVFRFANGAPRPSTSCCLPTVGRHLFPVAPALSDNRVPASVQNPDRTLVDALVNAPTARSRQAACRGPLIRLPDAAIGVPLLRAAAQAARAARRGPCCARLSAWWALPVVWLKQTPRSVRLVLTLASLGRD